MGGGDHSTVKGLAAALVLTFGGCSGGSSVSADTTVGAASLAAEPATSTLSEPMTSESTTVTPIDLTAIGDSFVAWADWPEFLAEDLSMLRGVEVALDDSLAAPGSQASYEPDLLRTDPALRIVTGAEVLILQPRPFMAPPAMGAYVSGSCGEPENAGCLEEAVREMRGYVDDYLDLAVDLVPPESAIVVILVGAWPIDAVYPDLRAEDPAKHAVLATFMLDLMREAEASATSRGIPVADIGAVLNGPAYLDAAPADYLEADGLHLSAVGSRVVADHLLALLTDPGG